MPYRVVRKEELFTAAGVKTKIMGNDAPQMAEAFNKFEDEGWDLHFVFTWQSHSPYIIFKQRA